MSKKYAQNGLEGLFKKCLIYIIILFEMAEKV